MALVPPFYDRRPSHPLGNLSLGATQRRTPADTSGTRLWLPSDLATTPKAWLDADSLGGADASTVSTFTDRMAAFDATLASGTGPVLRYSSQNGLKTVEFSKASAAQMTMSSSLMNGATAGAYFAVFKLKADPTTDSANGGDVGAILDAFTSDTGTPASHHPFSDGNFYDHFGVTSRQTLGDPTPSFSTSHRLFNCEVTSGGTYTNRIDATQFFQATGQTVGFGAKTRNLAWTNAGGAALYYLNGYVAEVLVLDAVPSASDQAKLEGYLAWKWGLQGNLPIGHAYAAAAPRIALIVSHDATGALTGPGSSIAGAAVYNAVHPTSGVLTGPGSTIVGSAARTREHATTGILTGPGSTVAGTSVHNIPHASNGAIVGPGSTIVGVAVYNAKHATSGTLTGQSSSVAGSAARFRAFATSGVITGPGSVVVGVAVYNAKHSTTGALTGQIGSVAGSAARFRAFATTGVLVGPGSTIAGSANHATVAVSHATSGALTGPGSAVAGTATRFRAFATAGVLTGQGSAVVGVADHRTGHWASGALTGQLGSLVASATRFRAFAATGALVGSGATLSGAAVLQTHHTTGILVGQPPIILGTARRTRQHATSGVLIGPSAFMVGVVTRWRDHDSSGALLGVTGAVFGRGFNGIPQLHDIPVDSDNLVNEPAPPSEGIGAITVPGGQIVNHPPYPAA